MSHKAHADWAPPSLPSLGSCFWSKLSSCSVSLHEYMLAANWVQCGVCWLLSFIWPLFHPPTQLFLSSSLLSKLILPDLPIWCLIVHLTCLKQNFGFLGTTKLSTLPISGSRTLHHDTQAKNLGVTHNSSIPIDFTSKSYSGHLRRGSWLHHAAAVLVQGGSQAVTSISCIGRKVFSRSGQIVKPLSSAVESALAKLGRLAR